MSRPGFLERLLDGAGVEWRAVNEVFYLRNGYTPSKSNPEYWENGNIPWFRMEDLRSKGGILNTSIQTVHESGIKGSLFPANSIIMATTATIGEHALVTVDYMSNQRFTNFTLKEGFRELLNIKFVYYYFFILDEQAKRSVNMSSFPSVQMNELKKWMFPIPCPENPEKSLRIQGEIVRILDKFTGLKVELTAQLGAELTARKKQYEYYRNKLLTFDDVEWRALGEEGVGEFIRGSSLQKKDFTETGVGCIHYGQIYTHYGTYADKTKTFVSEEFARKARKAQSGDLVIATTSENDDDVCKAVAWLGSKDIAVSSDACIYKHHLNPKYVSYFFKSEQFQRQKRQFITGTKVRRVNTDNLSKILIPIPPLAEQARIVSILDKFDTLVNSISEGLPREIELRQKQYEYYRNLLLDFPGHGAVA